MSSTDVL